MMKLLALVATVSLGCALNPAMTPSTIPISVNSHNGSDVDVYLLCGNFDAEWLGVVPAKETRFFEVPPSRARCVHGLYFFLVSRGHNRGYWVGPLRPSYGSSIALTIEKYAGLSTASVDFR